MADSIMDRRKWLLRLIYVRLVVFTIFVSAEVIRKPSADMLVLLGAVYALSACWFALLNLNKSYVWQAYAQIAVDLFLITWTVNRTGGVAVAVSVGASHATGGGRLGGRSGSGRWSGMITGDRCSGTWQASRS